MRLFGCFLLVEMVHEYVWNLQHPDWVDWFDKAGNYLFTVLALWLITMPYRHKRDK